MKIWALTDNKPGHQNQTAGLIQALSTFRDVQTRWLPALSFPKSIWMLLTGRCKDLCVQPPDLIIAAGHKTHWGLLALKRCCGGRAVVLMNPSLPLRFFDICLIPRHDKPPKRDNVIETLGAINRLVPSRLQKPGLGLILLGGESRHFTWDTDTVLKQIKSLLEKQVERNWTIATSRRTPSECCEAIRTTFPGIELVLPDSVSKDWLPQKIQKSEQVWVTEDSISMIYEALTSGVKTGLIRLEKLANNNITRVAEEIDRLLAERRVMTLSSGVADTHAGLNEANRCASILLKKFGL